VRSPSRLEWLTFEDPDGLRPGNAIATIQAAVQLCLGYGRTRHALEQP
jgi:hypothetical protein